jgi:pheromone shutdown-related protein TraB
MNNENTNSALHRLSFGDKTILLIGTAHISRESADLVASVIGEEKPDTVCVELCDSRYQAIRQKNKWQDTNIIKVIKEKKVFLLLSSLLLASFQKKIAKKLNIKPGGEMIKAIETGEAIGAKIYLADRDIRITLGRVWRVMGFWEKVKLLFQLVLSLGEIDEISENDIEKMKEQDVLESLLSDVGKSMPVMKKILIDERDRYIAHKIRSAPGEKIIAVVGAGHIPGVKTYWKTDTDIKALETLPLKKKRSTLLKWILPTMVLALLIFGFFHGGTDAGAHMIKWWIIANGVLAGLGALIAFAHPLTILSSILAAPLTSINPMIAAGWVSGLVEAIARKPKVKDFENLPEDILSIKGFWKNKVTRILLVVVFTNIGSSLGTMVALPLMVKIL